MRVLHLSLPEDLAAAKAAGDYRVSSRGLMLPEVGFIHTCTSAQLPGVARRFYADAGPGLVALVVDLDACAAAGSPVRWDPVPDAGGELFPHVYGPIPLTAIVAELPARLVAGELVIDGLEAAGDLDIASAPPAS